MEGVDTLRETPLPAVRLPFQVFVAKYNYDPVQYSPNDNPEAELTLTEGDYLFIYGEIDEVRKLFNVSWWYWNEQLLQKMHACMHVFVFVCVCVHLCVYIVCVCTIVLAWRRIGRVEAFWPEGRGFESRSSRHVGTLGKWRFGVKLRHGIRAVSGALLSSRGLEEALYKWPEWIIIEQASPQN